MVVNKRNIYYYTMGALSLISTFIFTFFSKEYIQINIPLLIILTCVGLLLEKIKLRIGEFTLMFDVVVVVASYFVLGLVPTLWLSIILFYFCDIFINKTNKLTTLSNTSMFIIIFIFLHYFFKIFGYEISSITKLKSIIIIVSYSFVVFLLNWVFILGQFKFLFNKFPEDWVEGFLWDFYGNLITIPLSIFLIQAYNYYNYLGLIILSLFIILSNMLFRLVRNLVFLNKELRVVHEVSASINSRLELGETTFNILDGIYELVKCDYCFILYFNRENMTFNTVASKAFRDAEIGDSDIDEYMNKNIRNFLSCKNSFITKSDISNKEVIDLCEICKDIKSAVYEPLMSQNELIGCILVYSNITQKFTKEHLIVLDILASQAAIAIENAKLYKDTKNKAIRDSLTGLYNQSYFFDVLESLTGECDDSIKAECSGCNRTSLIILDIDHFKQVNDTYGHQTGDIVLKQVTDIIKNNVRKSDIVSRYGGEEFTVILPHTNEATAYKIGDRIREVVEQTKFETMDGQIINITISGGVSEFPSQADSGSTLLAYADRAMYTGSKRKGRNKISKYVS